MRLLLQLGLGLQIFTEDNAKCYPLWIFTLSCVNFHGG